jgi:dTDP-4-amino-4,6-dideoxygalactose transaminase
VVEDVAQAIGATHQGRPAGSMGVIGCLSFYPTKNLGGFGDGGMLTTNDPAMAERLRLFAAHGMNPRYYHRVVGINSRLDSIQAAVLNVKLTQLDAWTQSRETNAHRYDQLFTAASLRPSIETPHDAGQGRHVWNQYTVRVGGGRRDMVKTRLAEMGVGCEIYYPVPLHQQECFRSLGYGPGSLPETERAAREVLSLPIFPELTPQEQHTVVSRLAEIVYQPKKAAA